MAKAGETQDRCTQYALDVVSGKITAGEYVRLACQRHLDDIEKSKAAPYKYYFDVEKSEEIINFAEELTIAEGEENEHVTAYPFQCFILGSLNGWRTKEKSYRRFRTSYGVTDKTGGKTMQMNDENIQTEEIKQAAEPEFKFPDDAESTSRPNETAEVVTRETAEETNTELLQSIDKKLDMLLAAQAATQAAKEE